MKQKIILFACFVFLFACTAYSQTLHVCENVDANNNPVNEGNVFYITRGGSDIYFVANFDDVYNGCAFGYRVYHGDDWIDGADQEPHTGSKVFVTKINFKNEGLFDIYMSDCNDYPLGKATIWVYYK